MISRYTSPKFINYHLNKHGKKITKGLGQNFLIDDNAVEKIISESGVDRTVGVLEIGPGFGALTSKLLINAKYVTSVEIDNKLWDYLDNEFSHMDNFKLVKEDVLKADLHKIVSDMREICEKIYVVANLPYNITTPIIMKFLETGVDIDKFVVMVQKEVALRMTADHSNKDYGALTVSLNYFADPRILFIVKPTSFMPRPKIDSAVIELLVRKDKKLDDQERNAFLAIVKASFSKRRKTLVNSLSSVSTYGKSEIEAALVGMGLDSRIRPENLSTDDYIELMYRLRR